MITSKKVNLNLEKLNGNVYVLMGTFKAQAEKEGWEKEEIDNVLRECMASDHTHLMETLQSVCKAN